MLGNIFDVTVTIPIFDIHEINFNTLVFGYGLHVILHRVWSSRYTALSTGVSSIVARYPGFNMSGRYSVDVG